MKPIQTGIAVALALAVVVFFFVFGGTWFSASPTWSESAQANPDNAITLDMNQDTTELQITDTAVGSGTTSEKGDTVTVQYVGSLTNGTIFDASANHGTEGFTFTLGAGQVIKGWDEGIVGMKEGGKRKLVIPPDLAYGSQAVGNVIPANSTLVFEVELVKVQKP